MIGLTEDLCWTAVVRASLVSIKERIAVQRSRRLTRRLWRLKPLNDDQSVETINRYDMLLALSSYLLRSWRG
jgi:hypothetical protein